MFTVSYDCTLSTVLLSTLVVRCKYWYYSAQRAHFAHFAGCAQPPIEVSQISSGKAGYTTYRVSADFDPTVARDIYGATEPI